MVYETHIPQTDTQNITYILHGNCYINLTNRCSLRCGFCPKFNKQWDVKGYALRLKVEPDRQQILSAVNDPSFYNEIVFCGLGEPTLRLYELLSISIELKQQGARIRVNTDGLANVIYAQDITPLFNGCVDALSISLTAHNEQLYIKHCRPPMDNAYHSMLEFVRAAQEHVPDITLTAIEGLDEVDMSACADIANKLGVKFRGRVLDEVG